MSSSNEASKMDWQSGASTIQDRMKYLLETGHESDVEFLVGEEPNEGEEPQTQLFKGHKLILSSSSLILDAQFRYNKCNGQENVPIRVIDISPSAFNAMLKFIYTNDLSLINGENFLDVYSAAKKYVLQALIEKCHEIAPEILNLNNVIAVWREAKLQEDNILIEQCLQFLDKNIERFDRQHIDFWSLSQTEYGELLARDTLVVGNEMNLLSDLQKWAKIQCILGDIEQTEENQRAKIGHLINLIRFPLIRPADFVKHILPAGILNAEKVAAIFVHYSKNSGENSKKKFPLPFSAKSRAIPPSDHFNKLVDENEVESQLSQLKMKNARNEEIIWQLKNKVNQANNRLRGRGLSTV